jgi:predicted RNA-binding protein
MKPGDRLIFYLTKIMKFGGIAEVTSEYFEDHTKVFKSEKKPSEDYPFRVSARPMVVLSPEQYLDVKEIAPGLEFTKKWPPEHWRLAFQGNLHEVPESDYRRIGRARLEAALQRALAAAQDRSMGRPDR